MPLLIPPKPSAQKLRGTDSVSFRLPVELLAQLALLSEETGYSRNALVVLLLRLALADSRVVRPDDVRTE